MTGAEFKAFMDVSGLSYGDLIKRWRCAPSRVLRLERLDELPVVIESELREIYGANFDGMLAKARAQLPPPGLQRELAALSADDRHSARYEKHKAYMRNRQLIMLYGITWDEKLAIYNAQKGKCANPGCMSELAPATRAHLDHCHKTRKIRGILCVACNVALGCFKDDPRRIIGILVHLGHLDAKFLNQ